MKIGGPDLVVMAGPCSVESREQLMETARGGVKAAGAHLLRGGCADKARVLRLTISRASASRA